MHKKITLFLTMLVGLFSVNTWAWNDKVTHRDLSEKTAEHSVLSPANGDYLKNLGFDKNFKETFTLNSDTKTVQRWIGEGGVEEDAGNVFTAYYYHHFHNPLAPSWNQAGLSTVYPGINGMSSLLWAQGSSNPWSWQKVRKYYYMAITSQTNTERETNFANTFKGLGHIIHLIEDAAQPAHVRDDPHPLDDKGIVPQFENWAKTNRTQALSSMSNPVFPTVSSNASAEAGYIPITQFWDTDQYNGTNPPSGTAIGISEYTNANFFSEDTIYLGSFPYPDISKTTVTERTTPGGTYQRQYYLKNCCGETKGGQGYLLSAVDYLDYYRTQYPLLSFGLPKIPVLDDNAYQDYASLLLPRAVGYSAALINYFFRGKIETIGFTFNQARDGVSLKVLNRTEGEEAGSGSLVLVAHYLPKDSNEEVVVLSDPMNVSGLPRTEEAGSLQFSFSTPVPSDARDLSITVAYRGRLGAEDDAVIGYVFIPEEKNFVFVIQDSLAINSPSSAYDPCQRYYPDAVACEGSGMEWDLSQQRLSGRFITYGEIQYIRLNGLDRFMLFINGISMVDKVWTPGDTPYPPETWQVLGAPRYWREGNRDFNIEVGMKDGSYFMLGLVYYTSAGSEGYKTLTRDGWALALSQEWLGTLLYYTAFYIIDRSGETWPLFLQWDDIYETVEVGGHGPAENYNRQWQESGTYQQSGKTYPYVHNLGEGLYVGMGSYRYSGGFSCGGTWCKYGSRAQYDALSTPSAVLTLHGVLRRIYSQKEQDLLSRLGIPKEYYDLILE